MLCTVSNTAENISLSVCAVTALYYYNIDCKKKQVLFRICAEQNLQNDVFKLKIYRSGLSDTSGCVSRNGFVSSQKRMCIQTDVIIISLNKK